jgi:hypothetical protein
MIKPIARIGRVADQERFRREDTLAMSPSERVMCLIRLRNRQFGQVSRPIQGSGIFSYRRLAKGNSHA